jgi:N-acetylglutamate synthase-like GNAT family acetyltransferase
MITEELETTAFPLVNRFFRDNLHKGKARSNERVFILRDEGKIVAALRACPKANGYLLRSVWVDVNRRQKGFGHSLVSQTLKSLEPAQCWCYPYDHLLSFYQALGFLLVTPDQVPPEIASPYLSYRNKGQQLLLMTYIPPSQTGS